MPKVSVYLPDELYRRARERGLSISHVTQEALHQALHASTNDDWIDRVRLRAPRTDRELDVPALLDDVRDEFGA